MEATFDRYESKLNYPDNINADLPRTAFHSALCFHFVQCEEHINGVLLQNTSVLNFYNRNILYSVLVILHSDLPRVRVSATNN
jgi:hypothetical protein